MDCFKKIEIIIIVAFIIGFPLCGLAQLITFGVWYSRIHPYFQKAEGLGEKVYELVSENLFFSIFIFIAIFLLTLLFIFIKGGDILNAILCSIGITICVCLGIHGINAFFRNIAFIDQMKVGYYAFNFGSSKDSKCYKYLVDGLKGADSFYGSNSKYLKWRSDFVEKAFDSNKNPTNYLCSSVGAPAFAFAFITLSLYIIVGVYCLINSFSCGRSTHLSSSLLTRLL